jgi:hypothetical protein
MKNADRPIYPDPQRGAEQSQSNQTPWKLESGLTKREYFAGLFIQGILSAQTEMRSNGHDNTGQFQTIVSEALEITDELLRQF